MSWVAADPPTCTQTEQKPPTGLQLHLLTYNLSHLHSEPQVNQPSYSLLVVSLRSKLISPSTKFFLLYFYRLEWLYAFLYLPRTPPSTARASLCIHSTDLVRFNTAWEISTLRLRCHPLLCVSRGCQALYRTHVLHTLLPDAITSLEPAPHQFLWVLLCRYWGHSRKS